MKAIIPRVKSCSVKVDNIEISRIGQGLLILLGVAKTDTEKETAFILNKIVNLRIFEDSNNKFNLSLKDINGGMMVVSQFTLFANCSKGRRPSFIEAAPPELANELYEYFITLAKNEVEVVGSGKFQAKMAVSLINDGPVTISLESDDL